MMRNNLIFLSMACGALLLNGARVRADVPPSQAAISVDAGKVEAHITPYLYGACIEDVNHEIYGGLYDQKIFGESFEEPAPNPRFEDFSVFGGEWETRQDGVLHSAAHPGAKFVYDRTNVAEGEVGVDLRMDGNGENAGLLLRVSLPGNGADNFYGYEVSLASDGKKIVVGKHKRNWEHIKDVPVSCDPKAWNNLKAVMKDKKIAVLLNGKEVFAFDDRDKELRNGMPALRVWNANAEFRRFVVEERGESRILAFRSLPSPQVSMQWDAYKEGDVQARYSVDSHDAYNGTCSQTVEILSGQGKAGVANMSLNRWGIALRKGQKLEGRVYLKGGSYKGDVSVALQSEDGLRVYAVRTIGGVSADWGRYPFELTSDADDPKARFVIYIDRPGKVWIDQVTLMTTGEDRFKGLPFRNDIAQAMVDQRLTFLRYGGTMINAPEYRFKKMIGDPDQRPPYTGHWYRWSTNGFGIEDFLKFCEAAGFTPAFAINIEETPQDVADMVEYLNGSADTEWGRKRAENGHPEPYGVKYIGIGNEEVLFNGDRADEYDHYVERFHLLHDAIKGKDSSVKLVSTAWWRPDSPNMERVFKALDGKADYWDYHPWADALETGKDVEKELRRMKELFLKWNPDTKMKCAIFEENGNTHHMQRALGHVTLQNAVRRMGDFVLTSCAANALQPYGQNDNGWDQGQVFFTPSQVWGMPPYYAQQMASAHHQPLLVRSTVSGASDDLDVTATRSDDGNEAVLHIAHVGDRPVEVSFDVKGMPRAEEVKVITLSADLQERNTPEEPRKVVPQEKSIQVSDALKCTLPPHSYTIVVYSCKK